MTKIIELPNYRKYRELCNEYNEELNTYRKKHGLKIDDVVAMSPNNDPFWLTPGKMFKAQWATSIMENIVKPHIKRINVDDIHLRDIHYMLVGKHQNWDGSETYQNTEAHWGDLITGFANARYLDLVDPTLIRDNKNKFESRTEYRKDWTFARRIIRGKEDLTNEKVLDLFVSWFDGLKNWHNYMSVHIELWSEKDLALLDQVAEEYDINTVIGEGETSVTQVFRIIERMKKAGKPVRIGYVADADPVGNNMSKAMARKIEYIMRQLEKEEIDVKLTHLMLTPTQVRQYGLPTVPMKPQKPGSKSRAYETRKDEWRKARGLDNAVEINSFHALYPDEFRDILVNFITSYFDEEIKDKVKEFNEEQSDIIKEHVSNDDNINSLLGDFLKALTETIDKLDWEDQEKDYNSDFEDLLEEHQELDYSDRDEHYQWLIDSELDYFEQLNRYNEYETGELDNPEEGVEEE